MVSLMVLACLIQAPETFDVTTVGKDPRWQVAGRTTAVVDTNGKHALRMIEVAPLMGLVWLKDYDFGDGTIEVDLLGRDRKSTRLNSSHTVISYAVFCLKKKKKKKKKITKNIRNNMHTQKNKLTQYR